MDHFSNRLELFNDSVVIAKCKSCKSVYKQLLAEEPILKSEKEIINPCRKRTLVLNKNGDSAISERDLNWEVDAGSQVLEYKIHKKKRGIYQKAPELALEICPESVERRTFLDLLNAIKNAH